MGKKIADMTLEERGYTDLHEHIEELRSRGLLIEIDREINKDTEMHPLVRWQFRLDPCARTCPLHRCEEN